MAKGIVTVRFRGAVNGRPGRQRVYEPGDVIDGSIGDTAIREGWARPAEKKRPANKAMTPEENKQALGVSSQAGRHLQKRTSKKSKARKSKR